MAKEPNNLQKSMYEMSDFEFMAYADYLSSPYYRAYMEAKGYPPLTGAAKPVAGPVSSVSAKYKRRNGAFIVMALCALLILAVAALGFFGLESIADYTAAYQEVEEGGQNIGFTDPIFGMLSKFEVYEADSVFYEDALVGLDEAETLDKIAFYAMPILSALVLIFALVIFIASLAAMGKKAVVKGFVDKKVKLAMLSLIIFIFTLLIAVCGAIWDGAGITGIADFVLGETEAIKAGYGLYAIVGLSLISFLANLFTYKKNKSKA